MTSPKVKDRSLLAKDFKDGELQRGATGATGEQGAQGAQGLPGTQGQQGVPGPQGMPPPVEAWHVVGTAGEPLFLNSWVNSNTADFNSVAFYKDPFGVVHLRGTVRNGVNDGIFQLPAGYYAPRGSLYVVSTDGGYADLVVDFTGLVMRPNVVAASGTVSLDGITFRVG